MRARLKTWLFCVNLSVSSAITIADQASVPIAMIQSKTIPVMPTNYQTILDSNTSRMIQIMDQTLEGKGQIQKNFELVGQWQRPQAFFWDEFPLTGWPNDPNFNHEMKLAISIDTQDFRQIEALTYFAKQKSVYIFLGAYTKNPTYPNRIGNEVILIEPSGRTFHWPKMKNLKFLKFSKGPSVINLNTSTIEANFDAIYANEGLPGVLPVFDTGLGRVFANASQHFVEMYSYIAKEFDVDLIVRTHTGLPVTDVQETAKASGVPVIATNSAHPFLFGNSGIYLPDGSQHAAPTKAGNPAIVFHELTLSEEAKKPLPTSEEAEDRRASKVFNLFLKYRQGGIFPNHFRDSFPTSLSETNELFQSIDSAIVGLNSDFDLVLYTFGQDVLLGKSLRSSADLQDYIATEWNRISYDRKAIWNHLRTGKLIEIDSHLNRIIIPLNRRIQDGRTRTTFPRGSKLPEILTKLTDRWPEILIPREFNEELKAALKTENDVTVISEPAVRRHLLISKK